MPLFCLYIKPKAWLLRYLLFLVLTIVLTPVRGHANGGPATISLEPGLKGMVAPQDESRVKLVSEDLVIRITSEKPGVKLSGEGRDKISSQGLSYEVEARYSLSNPNGPLTILYGVPRNQKKTIRAELFDRVPEPKPNIAGTSGIKDEYEGSRLIGPEGQVTIQVGSRKYVCEASKQTDSKSKESNDPAWCTTQITLPQGNVSLVLRYRDYFSTTVDEARECPFINFREALSLLYDFHPAGYWAGPVSRLTVRVELGPLDDTEKVKGPPGHRKQGRTLLWELKDIDLKTLPQLDIEFDGNRWQMRRWLALASKRIKTSALSAGGKVASVIDGKLSSTWCPTKGENQSWLEFSWPMKPTNQLCGILLALKPPNDGTSADAIGMNATEKNVRIHFGPCSKRTGEKPYRINEESTTNRFEAAVLAEESGVYFIKATNPNANSYPTCFNLCELFRQRTEIARENLSFDNGNPRCIRLEFIDLQEQTIPCISELAPLFLTDIDRR